MTKTDDRRKYSAVMKMLDDKAWELKYALNKGELEPDVIAEYSMKYHFLCDLMYEIQEKLEND